MVFSMTAPANAPRPSKRVGFEVVPCTTHPGNFEFRQIRCDSLGRYPYLLSCLTIAEVESLQLEFTSAMVNASLGTIDYDDN